MVVFPLLAIALAFTIVLAYFARKNVTWTTKAGTKGSVGMAFIVFIIFAGIGWGLDIWLDWSVIPTYMYAVGGALQFLAIFFIAGFVLLVGSMFHSAAKVGTMVA